MRRLSHFGSFHQLYASQGLREIYIYNPNVLFNLIQPSHWIWAIQRCFFFRFQSPKNTMGNGNVEVPGPHVSPTKTPFVWSSGCLGGFRSLAHPRGRCRGPLGDRTHLEVSTPYMRITRNIFTIKIVACLACPNTFSKVPSWDITHAHPW